MLYTIVRHRREFPLLHLVAMVSNGKTQNNTPKIRQALWAVYALVIVLANWGVLPIYMYIYIYIYVHIHFQSQRRHFLPKGDRYCACLLPLPTHMAPAPAPAPVVWKMRCKILFVFSLLSSCGASPKKKTPMLGNLGEHLLGTLGAGRAVTDLIRISWSAASTGHALDGITDYMSKLSGDQHCEERLQTWAMGQQWRTLLPTPYNFKVDDTDPDSLTLSMFLVHEVLHSLRLGGNIFEKLMGSPQDLTAFWDEAASIGDEWFTEHPVLQTATPTHSIIPIGLHGDDAGVQGGEQVLVITFNSLLSPQSTFDSRICLTMVRVSQLTQDVLHKISEVLRWTLERAAKGRFPTSNHEGKTFVSKWDPNCGDSVVDPIRARLAGKLIGNGIRAAWSELRGDWKFLKELLHLPYHYGCHGGGRICHRCKVLKFTDDPEYRYTNFLQTAGHRQSICGHREFMAMMTAAAVVSPILFVIGFHVTRIIFDALHTLDLGIYQVVVPAALKELADVRSRVWEGSTIQAKLDAAYKDYTFWRKGHRVKTYVSKRFKRAAWLKGKKDSGGYPKISQFQAKGAALRSMVYWMAEVCGRDVGNDHKNMRSLMFSAFVAADKACRRAGRHFSRVQHREFSHHLESALVANNALAAEALALNIVNWKLLPKHHAATHYYDCRINPRRAACNLDEDMVGKMKKIHVACHGATAPERSLQRYAIVVSLRWWKYLKEALAVICDGNAEAPAALESADAHAICDGPPA